jgi:PAS domain S-box-containing protein
MKMSDSNRSEKLSCIGVITAMVLGLYLSSLYSYLLFHSLIEITTIAIGFTLFILTWNTRRFLANNILSILGIGYAFIALIDLLHTLAYKGMNVFPGFGANLPTQLWIAARYLQAVTLCAAPLFVKRRVDNRVIFGGYAATVSVLVAMVYSGNFPDCYIEGKGLTPFKIGSEYVITALLLASSYLLYRKRRYFNDGVFFLMVSSIACTIVSEISFTTYLSVYGFANMVGHYFKLAAFYLVYRALLVTGLREPFDLVFRDLRQAQEAIRKAHDTLEDQVRVRTAELRASEEKYRALIESANDAVFIHEIREDGMPGPFIEVNELACRGLGYSRKELARMSPMELDDPRYRDRIAAAMERLLKDGHAVFETAQIAKDGRSIPVEVSTRVIEIRGKHLLFSLVRDITERKRAEEALFAREQKFRTLAENSPDLIIRYDCDCRRIYANPLYEKLVCLPLTEALGKTPHESWGLPIPAAQYIDSVRRVLESGIADDFEHSWNTPEGGLVCHSVRLAPEHDQDGKVVSVLAVIRDISELKKKEESLRLKELAISSASSGIYFADLSGELFYVNRAFLAIHGFECEEEMLGQHVSVFVEPERIAEITAAILREGSWQGEITGAGVNGKTRVFDAATHLIRDDEGAPHCLMGIITEITERKRADEQLALLNFALNHVHEAAYLIDGHARFLYVNDETCRVLGYGRDELLDMGVADIDPDWLEKDWYDTWPYFKARGALTVETRHKARDGRIFPVEVTGSYFEYQGHAYNLALARDITERKRAQKKLLESEMLNRSVVTAMAEGMCLQTANGEITAVNPAAARIEGRSPEQMLGRTSDGPQWGATYEDGSPFPGELHPSMVTLRTGEPQTDVVMGIHKPDGTLAWISINSQPLIVDGESTPYAVVTTFRDITAHKLGEESLRRLNRELRAISICNQTMMRAEDEQTLNSDICRIICDEAGYRMAWVGYAENDDAKTIRPVAWAGFEDGYLEQARPTWADTERGHGPAGIAIRSGESACVQDFAVELQAAPWRDSALQRGYRSRVALPLKDEGGSTFGVLNIYSTVPNAFTQDEIRLLEELSGNLAFGITVLRTCGARKRAERGIALLSFALNKVCEAAFLTDGNARFLYVNEESCRVLGYSRDELLGLCMSDIVPDFSMERWPGHWDDLKERGSLTFEGRHRAKDGSIFPVEISANYFTYDGQGYNLALARDITERKRTEHERLANIHFFESMDKVNRVIQRTNDLETMMSDVLDVVLSIFECDRAFLLYPCDPSAAEWMVPMERTRPEYPGALAMGVPLPLDDEVAEKLRILLNADGPVKFGDGNGHPLPADVAERFGFRSLMSTALHPKTGKPWEFGILQCSCPRAWTREEERLLQEIGRRLEDGLGSILAYRDLRESEARYRRIVDTSSEGIWAFGPDSTATFVNARMAEMLGCSGEEMIGRPVTDFLFEEDAPDHLRKMKNRRQGMSESYECRLRRQDGQVVWTHVSATPVFDGKHQVRGSFAMFTDITERKRAEALLHEREQEFRAVVENSPDIIARYDRECRRIYINPAMQRMFNLPTEMIIGSKPGEPSFLSRPMHFEKALREVLESGREFQKDAPFHSPEGELRWLHGRIVPEFGLDGQVVSALAIGRDITEVKRAEESLRESEERLRLTLEAVGIGIWDWDVENDRWYASPTYYTMLGYEPKFGPGDREEWFERVHPDDRVGVTEKINSVLTREFNEYGYEARLRHADGTYRWQYVRGLGIRRDEQGKVARMLGVRIDINERKVVEDALHFVAGRGWARNSDSFLGALARYLAETFGVDYVDIAQVTEDEPDVAETVVLYAKGAIVPNMRYALRGTPCDNVMGKNLCCYPSGMQELFPDDALLREMKIESYVGLPLWDFEGKAIGLIAVMDGAPLNDTASIAGVLQLVATRAAAELERKRADEALLAKQRRLSDMTVELSLAEERERRRIAAELHDNIGQDLVLAQIKLGMLAKTPLTDEEAGILGKTREMLGGMIRRVRFLTHMISPPILESGGLEAALKWLGIQMETDYGLRVSFVDDTSEKSLTEEMRSVLYQAVRELLINVAKHAETDTARVEVGREGGRILIRVEDDGIGFDPDAVEESLARKGGGFGLFNLRRRIIHLGGAFEVESSPGAGTRVTIRMPPANIQAEGTRAEG